MTKPTTAITLEGPQDAVLALINGGLGGLRVVTMLTYTVAAPASNGNGAKPKARRKPAVSRARRVTVTPFAAGDKVKVVADGPDCGVKVGDGGTVTSVTKKGRGFSVDVKWSDGAPVSPVRAALLKAAGK